MSNSHTPEPWSAIDNNSYWEIQSDDGQIGDACASNFMVGGKGEVNARRIVACVNACRGLSTKELEENGLVSAVGHELLNLDAQLAAVTAQRDELLAAMKIVTTGTVGDILERLHEFKALVEKCEAANG